MTHLEPHFSVAAPPPISPRACSRELVPETQYAKSGDVHIAYQVFGEGEYDLVYVAGFLSHVELFWETAGVRALLRAARIVLSRVILFDKRGMGLSDPVIDVPTLEERVDDVLRGDGRRRFGAGCPLRHLRGRAARVADRGTLSRAGDEARHDGRNGPDRPRRRTSRGLHPRTRSSRRACEFVDPVLGDRRDDRHLRADPGRRSAAGVAGAARTRRRESRHDCRALPDVPRDRRARRDPERAGPGAAASPPRRPRRQRPAVPLARRAPRRCSTGRARRDRPRRWSTRIDTRHRRDRRVRDRRRPPTSSRTGCSPPCCSAISSTRPLAPSRSATTAGASCSTRTTSRSASSSSGTAAGS